METETSGTDNPAMTFDEVSMERSKSFIKALQVPCYLSLSLTRCSLIMYNYDSTEINTITWFG